MPAYFYEFEIQVFKPNVHARVTGLPVCPELTRDNLPKTDDVNHFLSISGKNF